MLHFSRFGKATFVAFTLVYSVIASPLLKADPTVPPGFIITQVADNIPSPTFLEVAPDGRLFVSEKQGNLMIIKDGKLLPQPFLNVNTDQQGEHGLIGVAFDPDFNVNSYVYVYYVAKTPNIHGRVSRFTAQGDVAVPGSEQVLIELDDRQTSIFHVGGGLHFGIDGKLYISSGDNAGSPYIDNAQRLTGTLGKILRINSDGSIPFDNPYVNITSGINRSIYALGFRNPFSFSIQPNTGRIFVNDVGQSNWEEIDDLIAGRNYGWPIIEGKGSNPLYFNPIYAYDHNSDWEGGCAITGGAFYSPIVSQFPSYYTGKYLFVDYCNNWIHVLDPNTGIASPFVSNATSSIVGLAVGQDGSVYFASEWLNSIYKLSFNGSQAPQIMSQPTNQTVAVGGSATFSLSISGSDPLTYQWQKNGADIQGATSSLFTIATASMSDDGTQYQCVVRNPFGTITSNPVTLKVINASPPNVSIDYPAAGSLFNAGDTIYFGGSAVDSQDGQLPASAFTWEVHFQHNTHFHPFMPPTSNIMSGYFVLPTQGETSDNTWYQIFLTVKNSAGLSKTVTREIYPNKSRFLLKTSPPGLQVTLDGQPITTPASITGVVGLTRALGVISPQTVDGVSYEFGSWSDEGDLNHTFRTSVNNKTFTAVFQPVGSTRSGTITATPNPALVCDGSGAGITTLQWNSMGTTAIAIRINAPNGNLLTTSGTGRGSITVPKWIGDSSTFYLQDISGGLALTQANTLATVTVNLTTYGCNAIK